ncbi:MAG: cyclodeaminase/cyclohydrolase family protein [Ktedonobacteraceae bacterium]|nr:cyclodeaminase/cyclohydrolase family protein [Ktedonobacteraceae bacterium]
MYLEKPLIDYLNDLTSSQPTPGGGSAAALSGAMAAGLANMVVQLTLGKTKDASLDQELERIAQHIEELRLRFQLLMQQDIEAYGRLSAAFKMPRASDEERELRSRQIQKQLFDAALVPLEITEHAATLLRYCQRVAEIGNVNVLSDVAVSTLLAASAGNGASWMVLTNLKMMKDQAQVGVLRERLNVALATIVTANHQVMKIVGDRA